MSDKPQIIIENKIYGYKNTYNKILKHIEKYPNTTVKAAMTRLSNTMDINAYTYTTLSGGKDSGLTTCLFVCVTMMRKEVLAGKMTLEKYNKLLGTHSTLEMMKRNIKGGCMSMDPEMAFSYTREFYERMFKTYCGNYKIGDLSWVDKKNKENNPGCYTYEEINAMTTEEIQELISGYGEPSILDGYWCCFPIAWENQVNFKESRYWSFDPEKKDVWTCEMPKGDYVWNLDNFYEFPIRYGYKPIMDDVMTPGQTDQELRTNFSRWIKNEVEEKIKEEKGEFANNILNM